MAKQYDAIVIGGGPRGLTCGALPAKWGLRPLLLDKNETTGGSRMGTHQAAESGINVARMVLQYHRKRQAAN